MGTSVAEEGEEVKPTESESERTAGMSNGSEGSENETTPTIIGKNIATARKAVGLSRLAAAKIIGISDVYLYHLETGQKNPFAQAEKAKELLRKIAKAVKSSPTKLQKGV